MKPKTIATMQISRQMHAIEDDLDALLGKAGSVIAALTEARVEYDVDANEGQRILARLVGTQTALIEARLKAIGAHSDLKKFAEVRADFPVSCPESGEANPALRVAS